MKKITTFALGLLLAGVSFAADMTPVGTWRSIDDKTGAAKAQIVISDKGGVLTGRLTGRIIDAQAKADLLLQHRHMLGLQPQQVLAMGDGANDIPMLRAAGIGVAYRAKPKAQAAADVCIQFGGLEAVRGCFR